MTELQAIAERIAKDRDTDTLVYIGGINVSSARNLVNVVTPRKRRKNVLVILGTNGGDAHAAYKIARCLQHAYEGGEFTIAVYGDCKSAGTLVAIGAKSIVMCQHGELGPLDVQLRKEDQLFARSSGLTSKQALESLKEEALSHFEHFMLALHARSGYQISTRFAASIGIRMVTGLLSPIYEQLNPMQIGETQREMDVASAYGLRLDTSGNLKGGALKKLIQDYPSHDFAIDFDEAKTLFNRIGRTDDDQRKLGEQLAHLLLRYSSISQDEAVVVYLNADQAVIENDKKTDKDGSGHEDESPSKGGARVRSGKRGASVGQADRGRTKSTAADGKSGEGTADKASGNGEEATLSDS